MRLDHLLSKEHLAHDPAGCVSIAVFTGECLVGGGSLVEHWLFIQQPGDPGSVRSPLSGGHGTVGELGGWVGTLLGPEETGSARVFSCRPWPLPAGAGGGLWCCPFLENCTVDASI